MSSFVGGMITMGFIIAGLFFLRFWHRTGERLFAAFAIVFWLLAVHKALISIPAVTSENEAWAFLPTLAAYGLLALAVIAKNVKR